MGNRFRFLKPERDASQRFESPLRNRRDSFASGTSNVLREFGEGNYATA
jgi:hypothetical protein